MNTQFALMAVYGTAQIPLAKCCSLFGLSEKKADEYANKQQLPIPAFRLGSQKSPWLVDAGRLAEYVDKKMQTAQADWERMATVRERAPAEGGYTS